jgi:hypothetical protein
MPDTSTDQLETDLLDSTSSCTFETQIPSLKARTTVSTPAGMSSPTVLEELTAADASWPVQSPMMKFSLLDG